MLIKVFVQNEAGSNQKNYHDEKTLEYKFTKSVSRAYPYPYGFVIGTTTGDGCNVDCFIITDRPLRTGQTLECEVIGLMEQIEDGIEDHNILGKLPDENVQVSPEVQAVLTDFVSNVFAHVEGKRIEVGRFHGPEKARQHIEACLDQAR